MSRSDLEPENLRLASHQNSAKHFQRAPTKSSSKAPVRAVLLPAVRLLPLPRAAPARARSRQGLAWVARTVVGLKPAVRTASSYLAPLLAAPGFARSPEVPCHSECSHQRTDSQNYSQPYHPIHSIATKTCSR